MPRFFSPEFMWSLNTKSFRVNVRHHLLSQEDDFLRKVKWGYYDRISYLKFFILTWCHSDSLKILLRSDWTQLKIFWYFIILRNWTRSFDQLIFKGALAILLELFVSCQAPPHPVRRSTWVAKVNDWISQPSLDCAWVCKISPKYPIIFNFFSLWIKKISLGWIKKYQCQRRVSLFITTGQKYAGIISGPISRLEWSGVN